MNSKLPLLKKGDKAGLRFSQSDGQERQRFFLFFSLLVLLSFITLIGRLFVLTVVKGDYYRRLAESNRLKEIVIEAPRGKILDRRGVVLAENLEPNYNSKKERINSPRVYYYNQEAAHLLGYRQTADKEDLENDLCLRRLNLGDKIGKKGIEKIFDCQLRGKNGKKLLETDALGKEKKTLAIVPPQRGKEIFLAIDARLQKIAFRLLENKKGTIVALLPQTGEILVLSSSPSYDPQDFESGNEKKIISYFKDENYPLFNRATEASYPPGSIFKLVVATAGLEEKVINEKTEIEDRGKIKIGNLEFGNWYFLQYGKVDGMVDVVKAIRRSNDIFFYLLGEKLGEKKIKKWGEIFGFGKKTGIGIDESEGLIPFPFWKEETVGEKWYLGDTINLSIGQGYLLTTPLQVALATAVFANDGYLCKPQLLKIQDIKLKNQNCQKLPINKKTLNIVKEGMRQACSPGGTGWPLFNFGIGESTQSAYFKKIETGCKTGTAESHALSGLPHAWFTVFAPFENPEIVVTVLIEEGGQGSDVAAPIAKEILKEYFSKD